MKIQELGKVVAERRKSLGIMQSHLARLAGVSTHTLSNLESGVGNPTLASLLQVADVLGLQLGLSVVKI